MGGTAVPDAAPPETTQSPKTHGVARQNTARAKEPDEPIPPIASPVPVSAGSMPPEAVPAPPAGAVPPPSGSVNAAVEPASPRHPPPISPVDAPPAASEQRIASAAHETRLAPSSAPEQAIKAGPRQETGRPDTPVMPPFNPDIAPPPRAGAEPASPQSTLFAAPADQIGSAMVATMKSADGSQSLTIRLHPEDLGAVHIRIDKNTDGEAHVGITADRPETLQLLRQDEQRLQQALDRAGISQAGRTVTFDVAPPQSLSDPAGAHPDGMASGSGGSGHGQGGSSWRQSGDAQPDPREDPNANGDKARARWLRAGLDIVA